MAAGPGVTAATPEALAASVLALYRSGQSSLVLRLDPPGLGALSVHVALGNNADVNVLFVPTVAQTAHLIHGGLGDLRQSLAASGITLGQAQIGSGGTSGGSGSGAAGSQARNPGASPGPGAARLAEPLPQGTPAHGVRAVA
jgi:flagellar hook-length control protein FliK